MKWRALFDSLEAATDRGQEAANLIERVVLVSTMHMSTEAIIGVGTVRRLSAVRWAVAGRIVWPGSSASPERP